MARGHSLDSWPDILIPWGICITEDDAIWVCGSSTMTWDTVPEGTWQTVGVPPEDQLVVRFDTAGKVIELHTFPKGDDGNEQPGELNWVHCIAVDGVGNLYLGDIEGKRMQRFVRMPARKG